jgi:hypothetical protein
MHLALLQTGKSRQNGEWLVEGGPGLEGQGRTRASL